MIVPSIWFVFVDSLEIRIERTGSFEQALIQLRDALHPKAQAELLAFLEAALQNPDETDLSRLTCPELDNEMFLVDESEAGVRGLYDKSLSFFRNAARPPE